MKSFVCCLCLVASLQIKKSLSLSNKEEFDNNNNNWEDITNENYADNSQIDYFANDYTKSSTQPSKADLLELSKILEKLLEQKGPWKAPLVVFQVPSQQIDNNLDFTFKDNEHNLKKRSRYYRRYPWKRRNSSDYDYREEQYLCMPSRREVFKLLVALHGARGHEKFLRPDDVDFCKRHKPGGSVFTNIRFLGRRK